MMSELGSPDGADSSSSAKSTRSSARAAMRYAFFHWGLHPWAIYALVGLAMAGTRPTPEALAAAEREHARIAAELDLDTTALAAVETSAESANVEDSVSVAAPQLDTTALPTAQAAPSRGSPR